MSNLLSVATHVARAALGLGAVASLVSCTLLSDFDVDQCSSDADCRDADAARCADSRCVPGCRDNRGCAALDPRTPICPVPGAPCASLTSTEDECYASSAYDDARMGSLTAADMTLVGAFAPTLRSATWLSLELAVDEINAFTSADGLHSRPVLAVLCDGALEYVPTATEHLVNELGARVILASLDQAPLRVAVELPKSAGQALFLSPESVPVDDVAQRGAEPSLWHLGGLQRDAVAAFLALIQRRLAALAAAGAAQPVMVSLVGASPEDAALADAVEATLRVDELDARALKAFDRYRRVPLGDNSPETRRRALEDLLAYAPRLVLVFSRGASSAAAGSEQSSFVADLDAALASNVGIEPVYLLGPQSKSDSALRAFALATPSFRARAVGIDAFRAVDEAVLNAVTARFDAAYPRASTPGALLSLSAPVYDAMYYLSYASSYAAAEGRRKGASIGIDAVVEGLQGISDPQGLSISVGPEGLDAALPSLARRLSMQIVGTTGPADFDPVQRARPAAVRLWCWSEAGSLHDLGDADAILNGTDASALPCAGGVFDAAP